MKTTGNGGTAAGRCWERARAAASPSAAADVSRSARSRSATARTRGPKSSGSASSTQQPAQPGEVGDQLLGARRFGGPVPGDHHHRERLAGRTGAAPDVAVDRQQQDVERHPPGVGPLLQRTPARYVETPVFAGGRDGTGRGGRARVRPALGEADVPRGARGVGRGVRRARSRARRNAAKEWAVR